MSVILWLLQAATVAGSVPAFQGSGPVQVVLLPPAYTVIFNARAQQLIDDYWENYKSEFVRDKQLFLQVPHVAQKQALDYVVERMRSDSKIKISSLVVNASNGQFEFRTVPPGDYKVVAAAMNGRVPQVWTETFEVKGTTPVFIQLKNRAP